MSGDKIKLKSLDDEMFEVEEEVAFESQTVKNMIEGASSCSLALGPLLRASPHTSSPMPTRGKLGSRDFSYARYATPGLDPLA
mmetsp:Transcript_12386/g.39251  ORF Transcript_12386/g.39251 Transcript_12386/m.39251 type:complete len:83 (+) Transcript_12386:93-341(+)